jgi:hypothetical protein
MPFSGILCLVALVRTDVSEGRSASIIRVAKLGKLETTLSLTSNRRTLRIFEISWLFNDAVSIESIIPMSVLVDCRIHLLMAV